MVMAPLVRAGRRRQLQPVLRRIQREGYVRARVNGEIRDIKELTEVDPEAAAPRKKTRSKSAADIDVVVDRLVLRPEVRSRLADAVELSLSLGEGTVIVSREGDGKSNGGGARKSTKAAADNGWVDEVFSELHTCTSCGISLPELSPRAFSFNSPYGACEACGGLGTTLRFDPQLVIPDESLSLIGGAIAPWSGGKKRVTATHLKALRTLCSALEVKPETAFKDLPDDLRRIILDGTNRKDTQKLGLEFEGVIPNLERRYRAAGSDGGRSRLSNYQTEYVCERCKGARLKPTSLAVRLGEHSIHDITSLPIADATSLFEEIKLDGEAAQIADPILREIRQRLRFMRDVGLGYLALDRTSGTLSGGEAQRIRLATQLGSGLVGVCYVLDEPTIGLHQRDNERLLASIRNLVDIGNTVIVVEHDEDVIRAADHLDRHGAGRRVCTAASVIAER
jgi:excinuclease ABC subunit A